MPAKTPAKKAAASRRTSGASMFRDRICNVVPSVDTDQDFTIKDAVAARPA